jgi:hypothetical protein
VAFSISTAIRVRKVARKRKKMMYSKFNSQLHWYQEDAFVLTVHDGGTAVITKRFRLGGCGQSLHSLVSLNTHEDFADAWSNDDTVPVYANGEVR